MNHYWEHKAVFSRERGRPIAVTYVSAAGKAYAQAIRQLMMDRRAWYHSEALLHLRMLVCFDTKRVQEVDNRIKPLQDALAHAGVYKNDTQVKIVEAREGPIMKPAVCFVWLDEFFPSLQDNLRWIQNPVG